MRVPVILVPRDVTTRHKLFQVNRNWLLNCRVPKVLCLIQECDTVTATNGDNERFGMSRDTPYTNNSSCA